MRKEGIKAGIAVIAMAVGLWAGQRSPAPVAKVGSSGPLKAHALAPGFSLLDLHGRELRLADHKGKVILLDFWATWCVPCQTEIPRFVTWQDKYRRQGFQVIGISLDDGPKPVREFYRKFHMNYPVAMGNEKVARAYGGILGLPANFVIGRDGQIRAMHLGTTDLTALEQEIRGLLLPSNNQNESGRAGCTHAPVLALVLRARSGESAETASSAWRRSAIRSSTSSIPTE